METKIFTTHNKIKERNNSMTKKTLLLLSTVFALNSQMAWGMNGDENEGVHSKGPSIIKQPDNTEEKILPPSPRFQLDEEKVKRKVEKKMQKKKEKEEKKLKQQKEMEEKKQRKKSKQEEKKKKKELKIRIEYGKQITNSFNIFQEGFIKYMDIHMENARLNSIQDRNSKSFIVRPCIDIFYG